jgi:outer membrane protein OmpA-like peptidoglycan-associated protein
VQEDRGRRTVIREPGNRTIIRENNRIVINYNDGDRFRRAFRDSRVQRRPDGSSVAIFSRPGGLGDVVNITDRNGRLLHRYRRLPGGRVVTIIDNRSFYRRYRSAALFPLIALPALALTIPRHQYIVEYRDASEDDLYAALMAPPLERLDRPYSLAEIRYSHSLRERVRRVDLDDITFETGSWEIEPSEMRRLERLGRVLSRIIERDPDVVFLIEGHTDAVGSEEDNLSLSDRRAEAVAAALTEAFGVPAENLVTQGYGEEFLKVPTDGPERANRRATVRNVKHLMAGGDRYDRRR